MNTINDLKGPPAQNMDLQRTIDRQREVRRCFRELTFTDEGADRSGSNAGETLGSAVILYSSPQTDLPLIYEFSKQYDIPCTFEKGIPIVYSKPARSLLLYLDWVTSNFDVHYLWRLMYDGVPYFKQFFEAGITLGRLEAAPLLRDLAPLLRHPAPLPGTMDTGARRERYLPALTGLLADIPDGDEQRSSKVRILTAYIHALLDVTPSGTASAPSVLPALATACAALLTRHCKASTALERESRDRLLEYLARTAASSTKEMSVPQALERLRADVLAMTHGVSEPQPGLLHCAPLTGQDRPLREHRYVIGLETERTSDVTMTGTDSPDEESGTMRRKGSEKLPLLMTALRALANPHDESATRAFLRGPLCDVAEEAMDDFRSKGGKFHFFLTIPPYADDGTRRGLQLLKQGARWTRSNHPAATVALVADLLGLRPNTLSETDIGEDDRQLRNTSELRNAMALAAIISAEGGSFFDIVSGLDLKLSTGSGFSS